MVAPAVTAVADSEASAPVAAAEARARRRWVPRAGRVAVAAPPAPAGPVLPPDHPSSRHWQRLKRRRAIAVSRARGGRA
ncbi:hypothetical protein I545_3005 [Mycobacterium kansasii 662]|uniref:Uncharacterized protein n=1 Tax=Mycobacterium kansasii 662 TaxID=1299326 RepID=X7ZJT3_MYCKA|nr:hypothetical protein I545_3005 [Mycobacterium kansasii 662]